MNDDKRRLRQLKREMKKAGNRKRRRHLDRELANDPAAAHETAFEFKRDSTAGLNGFDRDATRRRGEEEDSSDQGI